MGTDSQFRTFQTVRYYEAALSRHSQHCRWIKSLTCACVTETGQPDINCHICKGRGHIYKNPGPFFVEQEVVKHSNGLLYPKQTPVTGNIRVWQNGNPLPIAETQPSDGSTILLEKPYPREYERVRVDYKFDPVISVTGEDSEVYGENMLRVLETRFYDNGKTFDGSIDSVTRVYNATKDETYNVSYFQKEYIYLENMGTWEVDDVLEVDYIYIKPFEFVIHSISARKRYERAYVIDQADATLITPYWANIRPDDLITSLSSVIPAHSIINPSYSVGNDEVADYYDLERITDVIDRNGREYEVGVDVELYGRNELRWLSTKPAVPYTVHFLYHPTFKALVTYDTSRHAENKSFVNRTNVMMFDKVNREVSF